jgi:hypothetical protein
MLCIVWSAFIYYRPVCLPDTQPEIWMSNSEDCWDPTYSSSSQSFSWCWFAIRHQPSLTPWNRNFLQKPRVAKLHKQCPRYGILDYVAMLTRTRPASHSSGPCSVPGQVIWDFWWINWHWGRFSPNTLVPHPTLIPSTSPHSLVMLSSTLHSLETESVVK